VLSQVGYVDAYVSDKAAFIDNPYPFQLFAYMVGFVMVFRTNFAYQRYWEALDALQRMGAKWLDGACMAVAFDAPGDVRSPFLVGDGQPEEPREGKETGRTHVEFYEEIVHLFSLLHALALQHLRCDPDLRNLDVHTNGRLSGAPTSPVKGFAKAFAEDFARQANEGLTAFSEVHVRNQHQLQKLRILGTVLPEELVLLDACTRQAHAPTLARVAMVQGWIMRRLLSRQKYESRGDTGKTSPPIVSRLYQVIADGHMGFSQASKVVTVPFPFPYHNMIRIFLWIFALTVPLVINSKVFHDAARFCLNFMAVWAYFSLCEVGDNLEDPFLPYDVNELPLQTIQQGFNARLAALHAVPAQRLAKTSTPGGGEAPVATALGKVSSW